MKTTAWTPAMHAVLDGEASAQETAALEAGLAADPRARVEFDGLKTLFDRLAAMEPKYPPEGLVASVSAAVREYSRTDQPFADRGVLGSTARDIGLDEMTDQHAAVPHPSSFSFFWEKSMNQQSGSNRKLWVGGGIAAIAAAVAIAFGMGGIPHGQDVNGTIVAAERYRAPQASTGSVQLGDMSVAELLQNDAFLKLVKDPQVQALMVEPDFEPGARLILENPDAVRRALAGDPDPQWSAASRPLLAHIAATTLLIASPEASKAIYMNHQASLQFIPEADKLMFVTQNAQSANRLPVSSNTAATNLSPTTAANKSSEALALPSSDNSAVTNLSATTAASKASGAMALPTATNSAVTNLSAQTAASKASGAMALPTATNSAVTNLSATTAASKASGAMALPTATNSAVTNLSAQTAASKASGAMALPTATNSAVTNLSAQTAASRASGAMNAPVTSNAAQQ